jgi:hypothetical protein
MGGIELRILLASYLILALISISFADNEMDINAYSNKLKNIRKPIEIYDLEQWRDGGSLFVILVGSNQKEFSFYLNRNDDYPIGRLFVNTPFTGQNGVMVPKGSELENQIVSILKEWLDFKIDPIEYQKKFPDKKYSDNSLLARHRYYVRKIIESIEISPIVDIFGAVSVDGKREKQNVELNKFKEAIKRGK